MNAEQYVDAQAVATFLQVSRRRVLDMTRAGKFPAYKLGTAWRYKISEVDGALQNASFSGMVRAAGGTRLAGKRGANG
ncbi:MAG TPA: helix-turn-helix domain-containing protein [Candidatus Angelobacter sp.]|nr:helix-turn-helix domain-containing protein [Candidatus Angelobacter sp.]